MKHRDITDFCLPTIRFIVVVCFTVICSTFADEPVTRWQLDSVSDSQWTLHGTAKSAKGIDGTSLAFDGESILQVKDSEHLTHGENGFTLTAWFNPYALGPDQQMIAAKNRYSLDEREWGVMIDKDGQIRLYARQQDWQTAAWDQKPQPGHWHLVGVTASHNRATLWVNGEKAGEIDLRTPFPRTGAPLTLGGVNDNGRIWQTLFGALDDVRLFDRVLTDEEMADLYHPVDHVHEIPKRRASGPPLPDPHWTEVAKRHASEDRRTIIFDGHDPDKLACDTTLRRMPDGSWVMVMLGGGNTEPLPANRVFITRSHDEGKTWSPLTPVDLGIKSQNSTTALVPSELMVHGDRCTMFVATHDGTFRDWKEWMTFSDDSCRTWNPLQPAPGRLKDRTFIRNHIVTSDGRILLPFQHYVRVAQTRDINGGRRFSPPTNPRNGVLISSDDGKTWTESGDIRISADDNYHGWAENNIVELSDGRIAMIIRADRLGGVLYYAESKDGGVTWPEFATKTNIPNPGSKATLYPLGGDKVALLHNPNPRHRSPLALWVSFDGMKTWPYQRVLVPESVDGPKGRLNYPDGFVSDDGKRLHFAFDDNRHQAVYIGAALPE